MENLEHSWIGREHSPPPLRVALRPGGPGLVEALMEDRELFRVLLAIEGVVGRLVRDDGLLLQGGQDDGVVLGSVSERHELDEPRV